jgi:hypothetical protein
VGCLMTYKGIIRNGAVVLEADVDLPDGTEVRVEPVSRRRFCDLLELAGTWEGDDADAIVDEVYRARTSAPSRTSFDS